MLIVCKALYQELYKHYANSYVLKPHEVKYYTDKEIEVQISAVTGLRSCG